MVLLCTHTWVAAYVIADTFYERGIEAAGHRATRLAGEKLRTIVDDDNAAEELNRALACSLRESKAKIETASKNAR